MTLQENLKETFVEEKELPVKQLDKSKQSDWIRFVPTFSWIEGLKPTIFSEFIQD